MIRFFASLEFATSRFLFHDLSKVLFGKKWEEKKGVYDTPVSFSAFSWTFVKMLL